LGLVFFGGAVISGVGLSHFGPLHQAPRPKLLDGSIIMFLLETRLKSESFGPLIDFPGFWVEKFAQKVANLTKKLKIDFFIVYRLFF